MAIFALLLVILMSYGSAADGAVTMASYGILVDILGNSKPSIGNEFLVMSIVITNRNYTPGVAIDPSRFKVEVDGVEYDPANATWFGLEDARYKPLPIVIVLDGGVTNGYLAYEVPSGSPSYIIRYNTSFGEDIPIYWYCKSYGLENDRSFDFPPATSSELCRTYS